MKTEIGEFLVGAYLEVVLKCNLVNYNVKFPDTGTDGLKELDIIGLDFKKKKAYLCEVTTHLRGVLYKNYDETIRRIEKKFETQRQYASKYLKDFKPEYMFWAPYVPSGLESRLKDKIGNGELQFIINDTYKEKIVELILEIKKDKATKDYGNPAFRMLQILKKIKLIK